MAHAPVLGISERIRVPSPAASTIARHVLSPIRSPIWAPLHSSGRAVVIQDEIDGEKARDSG